MPKIEVEAEVPSGPVPGLVASSDAEKATASATAKPIAASGIGERPACFDSTLQELMFVMTATMAIAMGSFTTGSTTVITSFVGKDLNMTTAEITWISSSSALAGGAFLLFFGKVADMFGRKAMCVGSLGLFAVFSLAAGFANTPISLDVLNGFMGLAAAAAVPPAVGILGSIYEKPSKRKNYAFACFSGGNPLGFILGTICSGVVTSIFNWRASFWWLAILYAVITVVAMWTVPVDTADKEKFSWQAIKKFDLFGTFLTVAGIGLFSAALSLSGDAPQGWRTPYVITMLVVGIALIVAFVFWENYCTYPLVPMNIWKDRDFSLCMAILLLGFMAFPTAAFWISLYIQDVLHASALEVAVKLLPFAIMGTMVNIFAGLVLHKISNKLLMFVGTVAYVIAHTLLAMNKSTFSYWACMFPAFIISVIGADLEFNVANMYVMSSLPAHQQSIAGSIFQTVCRLCITIGFGATTAIFNSVSAYPAKGGYQRGDAAEPYAATFWFSVGCSVVSVGLVPFLRIGVQGHVTDVEEERSEGIVGESKEGSVREEAVVVAEKS